MLIQVRLFLMDPRFESAACEPQRIDLGRQQSVLTGLRAVQLAARRPGGAGVAPKTVKNGVAPAWHLRLVHLRQ